MSDQSRLASNVSAPPRRRSGNATRAASALTQCLLLMSTSCCAAPSIVIDGKLCFRTGSLFPREGQEPQYLQRHIVLHDPEQGDTKYCRKLNTFVPKSVTRPERDAMHDVVNVLQPLLYQRNPYISDFRTAADAIRRAGGGVSRARIVIMLLKSRLRPAAETTVRLKSFKAVCIKKRPT